MNDCMMLSDNDFVFLSHGEPFIQPSKLRRNSVNAHSPVSGSTVPGSIGGYRVGRLLGKGAFGEVHMGVHQLSGNHTTHCMPHIATYCHILPHHTLPHIAVSHIAMPHVGYHFIAVLVLLYIHYSSHTTLHILHFIYASPHMQGTTQRLNSCGNLIFCGIWILWNL